MNVIDPVIEQSWKERLKNEFQKEYFTVLKSFLVAEKSKYAIYPPGKQIFAAFNFTPFDNVKIVIIGQDPYHGAGQANGFCFAVNDGIAHPPSLINIYKELYDDLLIPPSKSGNLKNWAKQGVLLLNAILTVRANSPGSHRDSGWEYFTDAAIKCISDNKDHVVFMLWGAYAHKKSALVDLSRHAVLKCGHPSPMSANKGYWFGNRHFSKANAILKQWNLEEVNWNLD